MFDESGAINDCWHIGEIFNLFESFGTSNVAFEDKNSFFEQFGVILIEIVEQLSFKTRFGRQIFFPAKQTVNFAFMILNELVQDMNAQITGCARQNDISERLTLPVAEIVQVIGVENVFELGIVVICNFVVDNGGWIIILQRGEFARRAI